MKYYFLISSFSDVIRLAVKHNVTNFASQIRLLEEISILVSLLECDNVFLHLDGMTGQVLFGLILESFS